MQNRLDDPHTVRNNRARACTNQSRNARAHTQCTGQRRTGRLPRRRRCLAKNWAMRFCTSGRRSSSSTARSTRCCLPSSTGRPGARCTCCARAMMTTVGRRLMSRPAGRDRMLYLLARPWGAIHSVMDTLPKDTKQSLARSIFPLTDSIQTCAHKIRYCSQLCTCNSCEHTLFLSHSAYPAEWNRLVLSAHLGARTRLLTSLCCVPVSAIRTLCVQ